MIVTPGLNKVLIEVVIDRTDELVEVDYTKVRKGTFYYSNSDETIFFGPKFAIIEDLSSKNLLVLVMDESNVYAITEGK